MANAKLLYSLADVLAAQAQAPAEAPFIWSQFMDLQAREESFRAATAAQLRAWPAPRVMAENTLFLPCAGMRLPKVPHCARCGKGVTGLHHDSLVSAVHNSCVPARRTTRSRTEDYREHIASTASQSSHVDPAGQATTDKTGNKKQRISSVLGHDSKLEPSQMTQRRSRAGRLQGIFVMKMPCSWDGHEGHSKRRFFVCDHSPRCFGRILGGGAAAGVDYGLDSLQ